MKYSKVTAILFTLVATAHLIRIIFGWSVQIENTNIPMFVSWIGLLIPALLAFWGFKSGNKP